MADRLAGRDAEPSAVTSRSAGSGSRTCPPRLRRRALLALSAATVALTGCSGTVAGNSGVAPVTVTETVFVTVTAAPPVSAGPVDVTDTGAAEPSTEPAIRSGSPTAPDPCMLLTQDEADQLAGRPLQPAVSSGPDGEPTMCQFTSDPNEPGVAQVTVQVGDGVKKYLDIDKDTLGHTFTQVSELGDEAWQEDNAIFVRKSGLWIGITLVLLNDPAENAEPLRAAATIAAGRA